MSSPEPVWSTPSPSPPRACLSSKRKREAPDHLREVEESASPSLKKGKSELSMKRTPQPQLTQSRLTGSGLLQIQGSSAPVAPPGPTPRATENSSADVMDTSAPPQAVGGDGVVAGPPGPTVNSSGTVVTTDFLLKTLKANTDEIIKSFTTNLGALSSRVDGNALKIADNSAAIADQESELTRQRGELEAIRARVSTLERQPVTTKAVRHRAVLSEEYTAARNSIRMWPIRGLSDQDMWGNVGDFIHDTLGVATSDVGHEDIISITRVMEGGAPEEIRDEVLVRFRDRRVRDTVMASSVNLAGCIDQAGRPTAGTRLEIPHELKDTFRLLSRFGTRLRARHGAGTKRHFKFDDYNGSMYANVKLPGDENWTRVSPEMARADLEKSHREEDVLNQRRLAEKLIPGPRERLQRPVPDCPAKRGTEVTAGAPPARRPRWIAPGTTRNTGV